MHTMLRGDFLSVVRTDVPMTSALNTQTITKLAEIYPFIQVEKLTDTAFGRPVWAMTMGEGDRHVLYTAAHHANEWITATLLLKFVEDLAEAYRDQGTICGVDAKELLENVMIHLVPMVNPDGVDLDSP